MKSKILFLLPYPPPYAGPEIHAKELLASKYIKGNPSIIHINSNIRKENKTKGVLDLSGLIAFLCVYLRFIKALFGSELIYMYFSSSKVGYLKDSIFFLTSKLFRKKLVGHYRGSFFREFYNNQNTLYQWYIRFSLARLDLLLVLGRNLQSIFHGIYRGKIDYLYNGLNLKHYRLSKTQRHKAFTVFFMGHLAYTKGFYDLIKAYKMLYKKHGKGIRLIFAGQYSSKKKDPKNFLTGKYLEEYSKHKAEIHSTIKEFMENAQNYNAKYLGFIGHEKKIKAYRQSDLFVLPSYTEGFSVACLEAMAIGLPVITTKVGAMPEVIIENRNGFYVEIGDQKGIASAIEKLLKDKNLASEMGKKNRIYVNHKFNMDVISKELLLKLELVKNED